MDLIARESTLADLEELLWAAEGNPTSGWVSIVMEEFEALLSTQAMQTLTVWDRESRRAVGTIVAGFLVPSFSHRILTAREPYVKAMALREIADGRPVVYPNFDREPSPAAKEAGSEGLHLHFFTFAWRGTATGGGSMDIRSRLGLSFYDRYGGTHLRLVTCECIGDSWIAEAARNGLRVCNPFPDAVLLPGQAPVVLMGCFREEADMTGNPWLFSMFSPKPPRLPLKHAQRRVLFYFRNGYSDDEIAEKTFRSTKSMKTTWDRIFEAVDLYNPSILSGGSRRRLLMEHLRSHPEEVWPSEPVPRLR